LADAFGFSKGSVNYKKGLLQVLKKHLP